jgi:hypothetical protein
MLNIGALSVAGASVNFSATNTGAALGDLMLGRMNTFTQGNPTTHYPRQHYIGVYMQDTWKATSRLTINAGLRWEPFLAQNDKEGRILHFQTDWFEQNIRSTVFKNAPAGLLFPGDPQVTHNNFMPAQWLHFAPRLGLSYDPSGDGKMTIRAAYGIFYDYPHLYQFNGLRDSPPWGTRVVLTNPQGGFDDPWQGQQGGNPFPLVIGPNSTFPTSGVEPQRPAPDRRRLAGGRQLHRYAGSACAQHGRRQPGAIPGLRAVHHQRGELSGLLHNREHRCTTPADAEKPRPGQVLRRHGQRRRRRHAQL